MVTVPLLIACIVAEQQAIDHHRPTRTGVAQGARDDHGECAVIGLGWLISKDLGRIAPAFFKRMDPATAGTVEFLIRFISVAATVLGALAVAGNSLQALAVGSVHCRGA